MPLLCEQLFVAFMYSDGIEKKARARAKAKYVQFLELIQRAAVFVLIMIFSQYVRQFPPHHAQWNILIPEPLFFPLCATTNHNHQ